MTALAGEPDPTAIEAFRLQLRAGGFSPLPLNGKRALMEGWARLGDATEHEIRRWTRTRPAETNTGVLTRTSPAFDIDILDPEAVERLARERFEESGVFPVRFGNLRWVKIMRRREDSDQAGEPRWAADDAEDGG
jgi:hypothetical protein